MNSIIAGLLTTVIAAAVSILVSYLTQVLTRQNADIDYKMKKAEELYVKIGFYSAEIRDYYALLIEGMEKVAQGNPSEIHEAEKALREKVNRGEENVSMLTEIFFASLSGALRNITQQQSNAFAEYCGIEKLTFKSTHEEYIRRLANNLQVCVDCEKEFKDKLIAKVNEIRSESVFAWIRNLKH